MADPDELKDRDVARILGLKTGAKLPTLLLTEDGIYKRDVDGTWYRLSDTVVADG